MALHLDAHSHAAYVLLTIAEVSAALNSRQKSSMPCIYSLDTCVRSLSFLVLWVTDEVLVGFMLDVLRTTRIRAEPFDYQLSLFGIQQKKTDDSVSQFISATQGPENVDAVDSSPTVDLPRLGETCLSQNMPVFFLFFSPQSPIASRAQREWMLYAFLRAE